MSYDRGSFSRIYNGKEQPPERFVLIGRLLLENFELKDRLEKIEMAQRTLAELSAPGAPYFLANDQPGGSTVSSKKVAERQAEILSYAADKIKQRRSPARARKPKHGSAAP